MDRSRYRRAIRRQANVAEHESVIGPLLTSVVNVAMPALGVGADQGPTDMDFGS